MRSSVLRHLLPSSSPLLPQHEHSVAPQPPPPLAMSSVRSSNASSPVRPLTAKRLPLQSLGLSTSLASYNNPLIHIDRVAKALQSNIQSLLDAQSEGLVAGLGAAPRDDVLSSGSLTPTTSISASRSVPAPKTIPIRQPPKKRITLRGARNKLSKSMSDFVLLRQEEIRILDRQLDDREDALRNVDMFEEKRAALDMEVARIRNEDDSQKAKSIRSEADQLGIEIQELETKLLEMKARYRILVDEAAQNDSSVQSKLSSYTASLVLLDSNIRKFLAKPPIQQSLDHDKLDTRLEDFYALNPKRRTLGMAKDHWQQEATRLKRRREDVIKEMTALEEGGAVWRGVVDEVNNFEKSLKEQTHETSASQQDTNQEMSKTLARMEATIEFLDSQFRFAEENGWNLLLCCIGAELEAFREGKAILEETVGIVDKNGVENGVPKAPGELMQYGGDPNGGSAHGSNESLNTTLLQMNGVVRKAPQDNPANDSGMGTRSESDDEDPSPEFLISHT